MTYEEIDKDIFSKLERATINVNDWVQETFLNTIDKFYGEYTPVSSKRFNQITTQGAFVPLEVRGTGNGYEGETRFDASRMNHPTSYIGKKGFTVEREWSEEEILDNVLIGSYPHGGYEFASGNTAIWTESMNEIDPKAERRLVEELKKSGLPIK